ncbi:hypothetical protein [Haloferula sargassicola]|uniref:Uncharacterized protein n=1 Tax=Haloferula sargassicola TaxID=490096 RepID=A0ABP9UT70_9BACT
MAVLLVGFPLGLILTSLIAWWSWHERGGEKVEVHRFTLPIEAESLAADLEKIRRFATPRHLGSPAGELGLTRMAAMIEGTLGPSNAGYEIQRLPGAAQGEWPILIASLEGGEGQALWVATGYDLEPGSEDHSGVATLMAIAGAMAGETPARPVKFCFLPHVRQESPAREETLSRWQRRRAGKGQVLWVESAGLPLEVFAAGETGLLRQWMQGKPQFRWFDQRPDQRPKSIPEGVDFAVTGGGTGEPVKTAEAMANLVRFLSKL